MNTNFWVFGFTGLAIIAYPSRQLPKQLLSLLGYSGVRTRGTIGKKIKTSLFKTIRFVHAEIAEIAVMSFCAIYQTDCDATIPVVKLFWWVALEPMTNSKCKPGHNSQWILLEPESFCELLMSLSDCSQRLWLNKTTFQSRRHSWKRMVATQALQANNPLAMS